MPDDKPVSCPKCHVNMERVKVERLAVDRCHKCGGLWLDQGELDALLSTRGGAKQAIATLDAGPAVEGSRARHVVSRVECPRDKSRLITIVDRKQPHIHFEACTNCGGTFLDAGELKDLSERTLRERLATLLP